MFKLILKATLAQLKTLLESANSNDLVGQISDLTKQAKEILKASIQKLLKVLLRLLINY